MVGPERVKIHARDWLVVGVENSLVLEHETRIALPG